MSFCMTAHPTTSCTSLLTVTFQAILDTCSLRVELWDELCSRADVKSVVKKLLLDDPRGTLRKSTALAIGEKTVHLLRYGPSVHKLRLAKLTLLCLAPQLLLNQYFGTTSGLF